MPGNLDPERHLMTFSETVNWLRFSHDGEWIATVWAKQKEITLVGHLCRAYLCFAYRHPDQFRNGGSRIQDKDHWRGEWSRLASLETTSGLLRRR
jgi:hypothetical protein